MSTEFVEIRRSIIPLLPGLAHEEVSLLLYLADRAYVQKGIKKGLTGAELARHTGVAYAGLQTFLDHLQELGLIEVRSGEEHDEIVIKDTVLDTAHSIPFAMKADEHGRVAKLEQEIRRLRLQNERQRTQESSGLADILIGAERDLVIEIEKSRGFALSHSEANLLGKCIAGFGPERTKQTYRQMKHQKNPMLATYASLTKGIKGKQREYTESEPFKEIKYPEITLED